MTFVGQYNELSVGSNHHNLNKIVIHNYVVNYYRFYHDFLHLHHLVIIIFFLDTLIDFGIRPNQHQCLHAIHLNVKEQQCWRSALMK